MLFTSFHRGPRSVRRSGRNRFSPRLEALDARVVPTTFQVTNLADAGMGSLRQAVLDANANPGADVIDFAVTGNIALTSGQLAITDGVAINGPGAGLLTVERAPGSTTSFGIFAVGSAANARISGLTLAGGSAGAVTNYGTLTISDSILAGNSATGQGGAIFSNGTLTVRGSTIAGNFANGYGWQALGGGIYVAGGTLTLSSSTMADNWANGGAYYYADPDSPYYPNGGDSYGQDAYGGAVYVAGGSVAIDHSTLAGNHAVGGVGSAWNGYGYGGGVYNAAEPGELRIYDSILADNVTDWYGMDLAGGFTSLGHNLVEVNNAYGFAASDLLWVDARLGPLQDNGGPTRTMALLAGSPAINAGDNTGAPADDQRGPGFPRIVGGATDIGAFELQAPALPAVFITDASLPEGNVGITAALFTVQLTAASSETVTVNYSTADGSATVSDGDYQAASGTLTFAPGETSKTIDVLINGDRRVEPNESFVVNLTGATNAVVADGQGVGAIVDEEPTVFLDTAPVSQLEGNSGVTAVTFTANITTAYDVPVTVNFATSDESATAGVDYQATSGTLTFAPGEFSKTITVLVNGDRVPEPTERFLITLSGATSAALGSSQSSGVITDDEPRISISDLSRKEGRANQNTQFTFTVTLSAAYDQAVTVSFKTVNGTATTTNRDYVAKTGTLTFRPGETSKTISIFVRGDSRREANETFYVDLFDNSGNTLFTKKRGIGTILNDD